MLHFLESHYILIFTYGIEVAYVANVDTRRKLRIAYNAVFRKIFHYRYYDSVRELQAFLNRPTWEELVEKRVLKFGQGLPDSNVPAVLF